MVESRFVKDGWWRALQGAAAEIEEIRRRVTATVQAQYAKQLAEAGPFRRFRLRRIMAREIQAQVDEEIEKIAPRGGLYFHGPRGKQGEKND